MKTSKKLFLLLITVALIASMLAINVIAMAQNSIADENGKVTLTITSDSTATIPQGAQLLVTEVTSNQLTEQNYADIAKAVYSAPVFLGGYDVELDLDGAPVELNGEVMVTLAVTADLTNYEKIIVVTIGQDGTVTAFPTGINQDGAVYYFTDTLSRCAIIGVGEGVNDGLSAGTIVALIVAGAVILSLAGLAFSWFVIHKKTFAELVALFKKKR